MRCTDATRDDGRMNKSVLINGGELVCNNLIHEKARLD